MVQVDIHYENVSFLSEGSFGAVFKARRKDKGTDVALKVVAKSKLNLDEEWDQLILEKSIGMKARLDNENYVLQIFRTFAIPDSYVMESELCSYGDILNAIETFRITEIPESLMKKCIVDVFRGLHYLQGQKIVHRDIKPENILVASSGMLKIGDFGYCLKIGPTQKICRQVGTLGFLAPELLNGVPSLESDLFSTGATIYYLRTRRVPYEVYGELDKEMAAAIEQLIPVGPPWVNREDKEVFVSTEEKNFVYALLQEEEERPTLEQTMAHPFLEEMGYCTISKKFISPPAFAEYIQKVQIHEKANTEEGQGEVDKLLGQKGVVKDAVFELTGCCTETCPYISHVVSPTWSSELRRMVSKPGPAPTSDEERRAAAIRYGLRPEDYKTMEKEDVIKHAGDYPDLGVVTYDHKDPYEAWTDRQNRRNWGEIVPIDMSRHRGDRLTFTGLEAEDYTTWGSIVLCLRDLVPMALIVWYFYNDHPNARRCRSNIHMISTVRSHSKMPEDTPL